MLMNGSPTGENMMSRGLPAGVVPLDIRRHHIEDGPTRTDKSRPQRWEVYDSTTRPTLVRELVVEESAPAPEVGEAVPEEVEAVPAPTSAPAPRATTTPKPNGKTPRKFEYLEALRGRVGSGDHQITRAECVALVMLGTYASADLTSARPGHARLAEDLGYTGSNAQRSVRELLASLARKGYVVITHHGTNVVGNVAAEYRLTLPEWEE